TGDGGPPRPKRTVWRLRLPVGRLKYHADTSSLSSLQGADRKPEVSDADDAGIVPLALDCRRRHGVAQSYTRELGGRGMRDRKAVAARQLLAVLREAPRVVFARRKRADDHPVSHRESPEAKISGNHGP